MKRAGAAVSMAALTALTAGCHMFDGDDVATEVGDEDLALIEAMLEETRDLVGEIVDAQERLILDCVERQGLTVHDQHQSVMWQLQRLAVPDLATNTVPWLPERDIAAEWGFGVWTGTPEMYGSEEQLEFESLTAPDGVATFALTDNSAFEDLPDEDKFDWYVAYYGEERALAEQGWRVGETAPSESGGLIGAVEPGGCTGEAAELLGLRPEFVPRPEFGEEAGTWSTFPQPPGMQEFSAGELDEELREERTRDEAFLDCLEDAGLGRWEFNSDGSLNMWHYLNLAYGITDSGPDDMTAGTPEPPADVPEDAEARRAWEIELAVGHWGCVDETGYEEDSRHAWAATYGAHFLELEEEIYRWQDDMRALISQAQELMTA